MKLLISRSRHAAAQRGGLAGTMFAVSFQLTLLPEEHRWVEQLSLFDKWVSWSRICPDGNDCTTPGWKVKDVLGGVQFEPYRSRPAVDCYTSLRQVLHAEADVDRGCKLLAATLDDAQQYEGVREIRYGGDAPDSR